MNNIIPEYFSSAFDIVKDIFPLHRSISGDGINNAFAKLTSAVGGEQHFYPTGTQVFDWKVPADWTCKDVVITEQDSGGDFNEVIVRFDHPLRVASHSMPVDCVLSGEELKEKLVLSEKYPNNLSHRYIYYRDDWSISVRKLEWERIQNNSNYRVQIDTKKEDGGLRVHELSQVGASPQTVFFLSHICHPAQFNDGLVGVLLNLYLYRYITEQVKKSRYTYKFLTFPETIGSHAYCSEAKNIENGIFAIFSEMTALDQPIHVQQSKDPSDYVNRIIQCAARDLDLYVKTSPFLKVIRNDEKVFNAPGIDIPAASITRAWGPGHKDHPFFGYHTDLDDILNADLSKLKEVLLLFQKIIFILENDFWVSRSFDGIPMLSRHGLFVDPLIDREGYNIREQLVWQLSSERRLSDISLEMNVKYTLLLSIVRDWEKAGLLHCREAPSF